MKKNNTNNNNLFNSIQQSKRQPKVRTSKATLKSPQKTKVTKKISRPKGLMVVWGLLVVLAIIFGIYSNRPPETDGTTNTGTTGTTVPSTTATSSPTPTPKPTSPEDFIREDMKNNGGGDEGEEYVLNEDVKPELDDSKSGNTAYSDSKIQTPQQMVSWLVKQTERGLAAIKEIVKKTQATLAMIFDVKNWHVLQAKVDGHLTDNTGFIDGQTINVGSRSIKRGDIFLVFVNPDNHKIIYLRGACANPQGFTPQLEEPDPTPTPTVKPTPTSTVKPTPTSTVKPTPTSTIKPTPTPQPKSPDPSDYKQPGDGTERDSSEGTKPTVPTVTETAESTPPKVETTTAPVETIVAPGATPLPTPKPTQPPTTETLPPPATPSPRPSPSPTPVPVFPTDPVVTETIPNPFG